MNEKGFMSIGISIQTNLIEGEAIKETKRKGGTNLEPFAAIISTRFTFKR